jgi:ATP-binding cassette subfamily F protein 3
MVNKEIDDAEFARTGRRSTPVPSTKTKDKDSDRDRAYDKKKQPSGSGSQEERLVRKEIANLEKTIAKLDAQRKTLHDQLMSTTDPMEAMRLHEEREKVSTELETAEMRWAELQEQIEES